MGNATELVLANALMRQALVAVEEVMGKNGLAAFRYAPDAHRWAVCYVFQG